MNKGIFHLVFFMSQSTIINESVAALSPKAVEKQSLNSVASKCTTYMPIPSFTTPVEIEKQYRMLALTGRPQQGPSY